jgi:hypothetical protein
VSVCIGDFWAASEGLDDLIIRVGRMIAYQEHNTRSPLNGLAAKWAAQHAALLPIDSREIAPPWNASTPTLTPAPEPAIAQPPSPPTTETSTGTHSTEACDDKVVL